MNLRAVYLWRNLTRNPRRTILTCAAVALPMVIFVLSSAVIDGVQRFLDNSAKQLRIAVTHKASIINPLPEGYRRKIELLDPSQTRLLAVCGMRWIGGKVENDPRPLSTLGVDGDTFLKCFPDMRLAPDEQDAWLRDRQAIVVGRSTAGQFGWKKGDRITIRASVPPYTPMEFHVVSTIPQAEDAVSNWFHRAYLEEELKKAGYPEGLVSFFFVKCASLPDLNRFQREIDAGFKGAIDETKSQDEKTFMNEFITQQFDLPRNLTILATVTVLVAVMAAANTMSMNFRDRINEFATLKSMGFRGGMILSLIQSESLLLCGIGGAIGALIPYIAFMHTPLRNFTVPVIQTLDIAPFVCVQAFGISLLIGLVAAVWPAMMAVRMRVVAALRNLE